MEHYRNELYHHGIKGQKWGVRRYQNPDGSLTAAGRARYGANGSEYLKAKERYKNAKIRFNNAANKASNTANLGKSKYTKALEDTKTDFNRAKENYLIAKNNMLIDTGKKQGTKQELKPYTYDSIESANATDSKRTKKIYQKFSDIEDQWNAMPLEKKNKIKKAVAIGAGVTVAAALLYAGRNAYIQEYAGKTLKSGTMLQTIGGETKDFTSEFYTTANAVDKVKYKGLYGAQRLLGQAMGQIDGSYIHKLEVTSDMKIAPDKVVRDTFKNLYNTDVKFRNDINWDLLDNKELFDARALQTLSPKWAKLSYLGKKADDASYMDEKLFSDWQLNKVYDAINIGHVMHNSHNTNAMSKLFGELKTKGYNGVFDMNDTKYSGYNSKGAAIIFDPKPVVEKSMRKLGAGEVGINYVLGDIAAHGKYYAAIAAALGGNQYRKYRADQQVIRDYKREHPNTSLSEKDILLNYRK